MTDALFDVLTWARTRARLSQRAALPSLAELHRLTRVHGVHVFRLRAAEAASTAAVTSSPQQQQQQQQQQRQALAARPRTRRDDASEATRSRDHVRDGCTAAFGACAADASTAGVSDSAHDACTGCRAHGKCSSGSSSSSSSSSHDMSCTVVPPRCSSPSSSSTSLVSPTRLVEHNNKHDDNDCHSTSSTLAAAAVVVATCQAQETATERGWPAGVQAHTTHEQTIVALRCVRSITLQRRCTPLSLSSSLSSTRDACSNVASVLATTTTTTRCVCRQGDGHGDNNIAVHATRSSSSNSNDVDNENGVVNVLHASAWVVTGTPVVVERYLLFRLQATPAATSSVDAASLLTCVQWRAAALCVCVCRVLDLTHTPHAHAVAARATCPHTTVDDMMSPRDAASSLLPPSSSALLQTLSTRTALQRVFYSTRLPLLLPPSCVHSAHDDDDALTAKRVSCADGDAMATVGVADTTRTRRRWSSSPSLLHTQLALCRSHTRTRAMALAAFVQYTHRHNNNNNNDNGDDVYTCSSHGDDNDTAVAVRHGDSSSSTSAGWLRWAIACGELCRAYIVNLLDEMVQYCHCSRAAFYVAVACLDRFVAVCADPQACCDEYAHTRHTTRYMPATTTSNAAATTTTTTSNADATTATTTSATATSALHRRGRVDSVRTFFTQVISVCAMLGCKHVDTYPPRISKVLLCLRADAAVTHGDFVLLELFVLRKLHYTVQSVTTLEVVEALLYMLAGGDVVDETATKTTKASTATLGGAAVSSIHSHMRCRDDTNDDDGDDDDGSTHACRRQQQQQQATHASDDDDDVWWLQFCYLTHFLCDEAVRGRRNTLPTRTRNVVSGSDANDAPSSDHNGSDGENAHARDTSREAPRRHETAADNDAACAHTTTTATATTAADVYCDALLELAPCLLALAIVAVAAELHHVALPRPLRELLPPHCLAHVCATHTKGDRSESDSNSGSDANLCECDDTRVTPLPPPRTFRVRDGDAAHVLLVHFASLVRRTYGLPSPSPAHAAGARVHEAFATALDDVRRCYYRARDVCCDRVVQQRYRHMRLPPDDTTGNTHAHTTHSLTWRQ